MSALEKSTSNLCKPRTQYDLINNQHRDDKIGKSARDDIKHYDIHGWWKGWPETHHSEWFKLGESLPFQYI